MDFFEREGTLNNSRHGKISRSVRRGKDSFSFRKTQTNKQTESNQAESGVKCFNCVKHGHKAFDCSYQKVLSSKAGIEAEKQESIQNTPQTVICNVLR